MSGINVHLYFLARAEKVKVRSRKRRKSDRTLPYESTLHVQLAAFSRETRKGRWVLHGRLKDPNTVHPNNRWCVRTCAAVPSLKLEFTDGSGASVSHKFSISSGGRPCRTQTVFAGPSTRSLSIAWNMVNGRDGESRRG